MFNASILSNEVQEVIKEEIGDVSTELFEELFMSVATTESVMDQMLLETITAMEKEIVQEEWEMAVVNYAEGKCNFTSEITDLQKELMDCHAKIEKLSEEYAQFDCHPAYSEQSLVDDNYVHDFPMQRF